ncbi:MAG: RES family NAD+ phosphorylase [Chitinophagales bacterium]|nr:RES family NAD+ phosphorylase [Chitinophagales bacterium]
MIVYNIRKAKYANSLQASGVANRWNKDDEFIIYTGSSVALSTLELVAHRNNINLITGYKLLFIDLNIKKSDIVEINIRQLPKNWKSIECYPKLQIIGSKWYQSQQSLVLKVPSALVHWENNYLINTKHPSFSKKVSVQLVEDFPWDDRLL